MQRDELTKTRIDIEPVKDEHVYAPGTVDRETKAQYSSDNLKVFEEIKAGATIITDPVTEDAISRDDVPLTATTEVPVTGLPEDETGVYQPSGDGDPQIDPEEYEAIKASIAARKAARAKKKNRPNPFRVLLLVVIIAIAVAGLLSTSLFSIRDIEVEGNTYFTDEEIINIAHAQKGVNLIYKAGAGEIVEYLSKSPYIESVKIRRKLPGTLVIKIVERKQMAAITYGKEFLVIDSTGILLRKTDTEPKLTILEGVKVSKVELGEVIEVEDEKLLDNALQLLGYMDKGDLYFVRIKMTDMYIRAYIYDSLVCIGTIDDFKDTIDEGRLQQVLDTLFKKGIKRGTITLSQDGYASFSPTVS